MRDISKEKFISEKIKSRFQLCANNYDILTNVVEDTTLLPTYLGGTIESYDYNWVAEQSFVSVNTMYEIVIHFVWK